MKIQIASLIFARKLLSSCLISAFHSFLMYLRYRQRQTVVALEIQNSALDSLGTAHFWPFVTLVWGLTDTSGTTGLDQLTQRCVKLRRQVFLNFTAEAWWESIVASFSQTHNHFHILCGLHSSGGRWLLLKIF